MSHKIGELGILNFIPTSLHAGIRNGTNTTNLSTYIQNAINSYTSSTNAISRIYVPAGQYRIESTITVKGHQIIFGDLSSTNVGGVPGTEFIWYGADGGTAFITSTDDNSDWSRSGIENIKITNSTMTTDGYGLKVRNPQNGSYLKRVQISGFPRTQVLVYEPSTRVSGFGTTPGSWAIDDLYVTGGTIPVQIQCTIETTEIRNMVVGTTSTATVGCLIQRGNGSITQAAPIVIISSYVEMVGGTGDIHGFEWDSDLPITFIGCSVQRDSATPVSTKSAFHYTWSGRSIPTAEIINCSSWRMFNLYQFDTAVLSEAATSISVQQSFTWRRQPSDYAYPVQFWSGLSTPTIKQSDTAVNSATGQALTMQAQNATGTTTVGGSLQLRPGTGTSSNGVVRLIDPTTGNSSIQFSPVSAGNSTITAVGTVTSFNINYNSTSSGAGGTFTLQGQTTSASSSAGGNLNLNAGSSNTSGAGGDMQLTPGTGTTQNGANILNGNLVIRYASIALSDADQTISVSNSRPSSIVFTGTLTATRTITISAPASTNVTGQTKIVQNNCTGGSIVVKFLGGGTGTTIAPGNSSIVVADGTNATTLMRGVGSLAAGIVHSDSSGNLSSSGIQLASTSVGITSGTTTLSATQYRFGYIILTGSLSGSNTIIFPSIVGAKWIVDATAVTLNANTITLQANSINWGTTVGITNIYSITYGGTGKLYGNALTP